MYLFFSFCVSLEHQNAVLSINDFVKMAKIRIQSWLIILFFAISHSTEPVFSTAIPSIASFLNVPHHLAQISSSVYFSGFSIGILVFGRVSDLIGRKPTIVTGLLLYSLGSISCVFTQSINMLLFFRFIQAFGVSVGSCVAQAIIRDVYRGNALSYMYNLVAMSMSLIPSVSASISGLFIENYSWQYSLIFLSFMGLGILLLSVWKLPETNRYIDVARNTFYFRLIRKILTDRKILAHALIVGCCNGIFFGFYVEAPFIFMNLLNFSPSKYGLLLFIMSIGLFCSCIGSNMLIKRYVSTYKIITFGIILSFLGSLLFLMTALYFDSLSRIMRIEFIAIARIIYFFGHSFIVPHILRFALSDYSKVNGTAGSIFGAIYYFIVAFVNFLIAQLHTHTIIPLSVLQMALSCICIISFVYIRKRHKGSNISMKHSSKYHASHDNLKKI